MTRPGPSPSRVIVVGAGVFGLAIALSLARVGADILLIDETATAPSASAIAAGMLAPAFEAALDPASHGRFDLLHQARDLWPAFVEDLESVGLERCGATFDGDEDVCARIAAALRAQGAAIETGPAGLFTPDDWRIEPRLALAATRAGLIRLGGRTITGRVVGAARDHVILDDGSRHGADAVVLACGFGGRNLADELAVLTPVKGQILRFPGAGPSGGPILRTQTSYLVPGADGAAVGASMQEGVSDLAIDPAVTAWLRAQAAILAPRLAGAPAAAFAGVRPATPDGLPMIGQAQGGMWLAAGARRNGWLLAPLAAQLIARGIAGGADDLRFSPARFSPRS